jgi:hypothetical protein
MMVNKGMWSYQHFLCRPSGARRESSTFPTAYAVGSVIAPPDGLELLSSGQCRTR